MVWLAASERNKGGDRPLRGGVALLPPAAEQNPPFPGHDGSSNITLVIGVRAQPYESADYVREELPEELGQKLSVLELTEPDQALTERLKLA
ncbi:hypothetical protein JK359_03430 [Streptomyces actinomycinicus]|uniref:Uncharacterized protein n=1 Tax=Streptomyces actinomycinicus TaxID=1695166 RepID=A0A937EF31_9ACTN|nr:hypothetical protein [Streptomyces actinomycinicus]MBL1081031.1 hypothetical protein [Streptomyces actinomycinicus]